LPKKSGSQAREGFRRFFQYGSVVALRPGICGKAAKVNGEIEMRKVIGLFVLLLLVTGQVNLAEAALILPPPLTIGFEGIGVPGDPQIDLDNQIWGKLHLFAELSEVDDQNVYFKFINTDASVSPSTITAVYFDDDVFEAGADVLSSPVLDNSSAGVNFGFGDSNSKPPRGAELDPQWKKEQTDFSALSTAPTAGNGVNSISEYFGMTFVADYDAVVSALENNTLRIALHVQSFPDNEGSMTFVNVPEPATLAVLALGGMCLITRRKK